MASPFAFIAQLVDQVFAHCECGNCKFYSLGVVCSSCSRRVCLRHGVVTLTSPPVAKCVPCLLADHADLLKKADIVGGKVVFQLAPRSAA